MASDRQIRTVRRAVKFYLESSKPYHWCIVGLPLLLAVPLTTIMLWKIANGTAEIEHLAPGGVVMAAMTFAINRAGQIQNCIGQACFLETKIVSASNENVIEIINSLSCLKLKECLTSTVVEELENDQSQ